VVRDSMTPAGLWSLGSPGRFEVAFVPRPGVLVALALGSLGLVALMQAMEPTLRAVVRWELAPRGRAVAWGVGAGAALALAALVVTRPLMAQPLGALHGPLTLAGVLLLAYAGNLYEELLFRGYLQGLLEGQMAPLHAALGSGLAFALGHVFLASAVTGLGAPLLIFTLAEGILCGLLRQRLGLVAAAAAHGTIIAVLASGV